MKTKVMKLADIKPADYNPRVKLTENDFQYKALKASIDEFGLVIPLIVNERTGTLISGHQRLNVLLASGEKKAEVVLVDFPVEKEKALCIAMNKIEGEWDYGKLADIIEELKADGGSLLETGFSNAEIKSLLGEIDDEIASGHEPEDPEDDEGGDVDCMVGEYRFRLSEDDFKDMQASIRVKVGFARPAVEAELKRRLLV